MWIRQEIVRFAVLLLIVLGVASCAPAGDRDVDAAVAASPAARPDTDTAGTLVEETPMTEAELTPESPQHSEAAAATESGGTAMDAEERATPSSEGMELFQDSTYGFEIEYPGGYVVRALPSDRLAIYQPSPAAAVTIMSPVLAASDAVELEAADLEIKVFETGDIPSLEGWLALSGLLPGGSTTAPFQSTHLSGVKVCASTMVAPGCSYFVAGVGRVYELRPASLEGESMMQSFRLIS